jgi:hypothetical protein
LKEDRNTARKLINPLVPYIFAGVGAFYFKPQKEIKIGDEPTRLQSLAPLMLSGVKYSQISVAIPIGIGFRYYLTRRFLLGGEFGLRYTGTSYIDDIGGTDTYIDTNKSPFPKAASFLYGNTDTDKNIGDYRGKIGLSKLPVNDIYALFGVTAAYNFSKHKESRSRIGKRQWCPRFY